MSVTPQSNSWWRRVLLGVCILAGLLAALVLLTHSSKAAPKPPPLFPAEVLFAGVNEALPPSQAPAIYVATVAQHAYLNRLQLMSIDCYARAHSYSYLQLDADSDTSPMPFEFLRHAVLSQALEKLEPNALVYGEADVVFVEEEQPSRAGQISSTSFLVRNTPFSRALLANWANLYGTQAQSSKSRLLKLWRDDSSVLHVLLASLLVRSRGQPCYEAYAAYAAAAEPSLTEHWNVLACSKFAIGPPRRWLVDKQAGAGRAVIGAVTVLPRYHGWLAHKESLLEPFNRVLPFIAAEVSSQEAIALLDFNAPIPGSPCRRQGMLGIVTPDDEHLMHFWLQAQLSYESRRPALHFQLPLWAFDEDDDACVMSLSCAPLGPHDRSLLPRHAPDSSWSRIFADDV